MKFSKIYVIIMYLLFLLLFCMNLNKQDNYNKKVEFIKFKTKKKIK